MSTIKSLYAAAASITCSIASKTSGQGRRSAAIDNSTNAYIDAFVTFGVLVGTIAAPANFAVYAYASGDDGSNYYSEGSTDADYNTIRGDEVGPVLVRAAPASTTTYFGVGTVARAYGGTMPRNWGVIFTQTGCGTLSSTEGNHTKKYQGYQISNV